MSIFDTRKSRALVARNDLGDVAVHLPEHGTDDYPWAGFEGPFDVADETDAGWAAAGLITGTAEYFGPGDTLNGESWAHHIFNVRMRFEGRQMTTKYRVGTGWAKAPTVQHVLESMLADHEHARFGVDDMGYDDERAALVARAIERQTARLRKFLAGL